MTTEEIERGLWTDDEAIHAEETAIAVINDNAPGVPNAGSVNTSAQVMTVSHTRTLADDPYTGVAALPFDDRAQDVLAKHQTVPDEWIDIRPEGLIYLSHINARRILNAAFGFGGWAIVPVGEFRREEKGNQVILYRTYRMYVNGRYAGEVEASGEYWTNNSAQNYADAAEACQSYALNRLSKNFGIASQCWDKSYGEQWKSKFAEQVENPRTGKKEWKKKLGAGSPPAVTREPSDTPPEKQSDKPAETSTPQRPGAGSAPKNQTAVIQIASLGKGWMYGNTPNQMCKDSAGRSWKLVGAAVIETANKSGGAPIKVEYVRETTPKGVVSAVVDAQIVGGQS